MNIHSVANFLRLISETGENSMDDWDSIDRKGIKQRIKSHKEEEGVPASEGFVSAEEPKEHFRSPKRHHLETTLVTNSEEDIRRFLLYFAKHRSDGYRIEPAEKETDIFITDHDAPLVWEVFYNTDWSALVKGSDKNSELREKIKQIISRSAYELYSKLTEDKASKVKSKKEKSEEEKKEAEEWVKKRNLKNINYLFSLFNIMASILSNREISLFRKNPIYRDNIGKPFNSFFNSSAKNSYYIKKYNVIQTEVPPELELAISNLCKDSLRFEEVYEILDDLDIYASHSEDLAAQEYKRKLKEWEGHVNFEKEKEDIGHITKEEYVRDKVYDSGFSSVFLNASISKKTFFKTEDGVADNDIIRARRGAILRNLSSFLNELLRRMKEEFFQELQQVQSPGMIDIQNLVTEIYEDSGDLNLINIAIRIAKAVIYSDEETEPAFTYEEFLHDIKGLQKLTVNFGGKKYNFSPVRKILDEISSVQLEDEQEVGKKDPTKINLEDTKGIKRIYQKYSKLASFYMMLNGESPEDILNVISPETKANIKSACNEYEINNDQKVFEPIKKQVATDIVNLIKSKISTKLLNVEGIEPVFQLEPTWWEKHLFVYPYGAFINSFHIVSSESILSEGTGITGPADVSMDLIRSGKFSGDFKKLMNFTRTAGEMDEFLEINSQVSDNRKLDKEYLLDSCETILADIGYKIIIKTGAELFRILLANMGVEEVEELQEFKILFSYLLLESRYYNRKQESKFANKDKHAFIRMLKRFQNSIMNHLSFENEEPEQLYGDLLTRNDLVKVLLQQNIMKMTKRMVDEDGEEVESTPEEKDKDFEDAEKSEDRPKRKRDFSLVDLFAKKLREIDKNTPQNRVNLYRNTYEDIKELPKNYLEIVITPLLHEKFGEKLNTVPLEQIAAQFRIIVAESRRLAEEHGFTEFELYKYMTFDDKKREIYDVLETLDRANGKERAFILLYMEPEFSSKLFSAVKPTSDLISQKIEEIYNGIVEIMKIPEDKKYKKVPQSDVPVDKITEDVRQVLGYLPTGKREESLAAAENIYYQASEFYDKKGERLADMANEKIRKTRVKLEKLLLQYSTNVGNLLTSFRAALVTKISPVSSDDYKKQFEDYISFLKTETFGLTQRLNGYAGELKVANFREELKSFLDSEELAKYNVLYELEVATYKERKNYYLAKQEEYRQIQDQYYKDLEIYKQNLENFEAKRNKLVLQNKGKPLSDEQLQKFEEENPKPVEPAELKTPRMPKEPRKEGELQFYIRQIYRFTSLLWQTGASSLERKYALAFEKYEEPEDYEREEEEVQPLSGELNVSSKSSRLKLKDEQPGNGSKQGRVKSAMDVELEQDKESNLPPEPEKIKQSTDSKGTKPPRKRGGKGVKPITENRTPKIRITFKKKDDKFYEIVNNTPDDFTDLISIMDEFIPYSKEYLGYNKPVKIVLDYPQDYRDPFAPTGQYDPTTSTVVVFVQGRHPKDILRSLSHELTHHHQNCKGMFVPKLMGDGAVEGYAQKNSHLRKMEQEATNLMLRDFEDKRRKKNGR